MPEKKTLRFEFRETDLGVIFRVAEQSHRGDKFGEGEDGCDFHAKDGLVLESDVCPTSTEEYGRVNVRGIDKSEDDRLCACTHAFAERIRQAEREYNEFFRGEAADYAIGLQRAIEYHCKDTQIPWAVEEACPHHAKMLNDQWRRNQEGPEPAAPEPGVELREIREVGDLLVWRPAGDTWVPVEGDCGARGHKRFRGFQFSDGAVSTNLRRWRLLTEDITQWRYSREFYPNEFGEGIQGVEWDHAAHVRLAKEEQP